MHPFLIYTKPEIEGLNMNFSEYKNELERISQNSTKLNENLVQSKHKMFMKGKNLSRQFQETFDAVKQELQPFEKADLIDYWKFENGRTNKKR